MSAAKPKDDQIERPARLTPDHERNRSYRNEHGQIVMGDFGWSKLSKLAQTFHKGKLEDPDEKDEQRREMDAKARFIAGDRYSDIWSIAGCSGRNHLSQDRVSGGFQSGNIGQAQSKAIRQIVEIESHLGSNDRQIVRMVCGEDHTPSQAVLKIAPAYRDRVLVRFREALDALVNAMETARRL